MKLRTWTLLGLVACGEKDTANDSDPGTDDSAAADDTGELEMDGGVLYGAECAVCHGDDGTGTASGDNIIPELGRHDDAFLVDVILNGHGEMAPVDVTPEQAQAIVDWMRANFQ